MVGVVPCWGCPGHLLVASLVFGLLRWQMPLLLPLKVCCVDLTCFSLALLVELWRDGGEGVGGCVRCLVVGGGKKEDEYGNKRMKDF